jgi:hypothetical protein
MKFRPARAAAAGVLLEAAVTREAELLLSPTISGGFRSGPSPAFSSHKTRTIWARRHARPGQKRYPFWWLRANHYCFIVNAWDVGVVVKFELQNEIACVSGNDCEDLETEREAIELGGHL